MEYFIDYAQLEEVAQDLETSAASLQAVRESFYTHLSALRAAVNYKVYKGDYVLSNDFYRASWPIERELDKAPAVLRGGIVRSALGYIVEHCRDYEARVIADLDQRIMAGNGFSGDARDLSRSTIEEFLVAQAADDAADAISGLFGDGSGSGAGDIDFGTDWVGSNHPGLAGSLGSSLGLATWPSSSSSSWTPSSYDPFESGSGGGLGGGSGGGLGDLGDIGGGLDDFGGSGGGGLGDLGGLGSSLGGLGDLGGFGGAADEAGLVSDLLSDAFDPEQLKAAQEVVQKAATAGVASAAGTGVAAISGALDAMMSTVEYGKLAACGDALSDFAAKYAAQIGLVLGVAGALYATKSQTTEAVAHCAEFVSTKCVPAVNEALDKVGTAVKAKRVSLGSVAGNAVAAPAEVGGLLG